MDDETKERLVRAILLFCALVIAGVAAYTTFMLFSTYEIDISFSPPEDAARFNPPEEAGPPRSSFDIEQEHEDSNGKTTYKDEEIKPYKESNPIMKSPLIISEDLGEGGGRFVFIVIVLEVIAIFMIYRRLDKKIRKN